MMKASRRRPLEDDERTGPSHEPTPIGVAVHVRRAEAGSMPRFGAGHLRECADTTAAGPAEAFLNQGH